MKTKAECLIVLHFPLEEVTFVVILGKNKLNSTKLKSQEIRRKLRQLKIYIYGDITYFEQIGLLGTFNEVALSAKSVDVSVIFRV